MKIEILDTVDSTNEYILRYLPFRTDVVVSARRQTGGKGTKGRAFLSEEGGVYLSLLRFYKNVPAKNAFCVMAHAAVAVCRTAEEFGLNPEIKWPNDVNVAGRKLAGILIENVMEKGLLEASITGVGLNVNNELDALNGIAVSMKEALGRTLDVDEVRERLIEHLTEESHFSDYLERVRFCGREVTVTENGVSYLARAVRVEEDGRLRVECGKEERLLSAAEISLKI